MPQLYCDIYATPTVCPTQTSLTSLAHELHYVVSANYYVAVAWETTGAEDRMKQQITTLSLHVTDSLLSLPLG